MSDQSRRKLLKSIAAGSGAIVAGKSLPDSWSRPVVDSVMLPAHALTSMSSFSGSNSNDQGSISPDSQFARTLDALVSEAHADDPMDEAQSCIQQNGDGTVRVDSIIGDGYMLMKLNAESVIVGGSAVAMSGESCFVDMKVIEKPLEQTMLDKLGLIQDSHAGLRPENIQVRIDSIDGRALGQYLLYEGKRTIDIDLPIGECSPPDCPAPV